MMMVMMREVRGEGVQVREGATWIRATVMTMTMTMTMMMVRMRAMIRMTMTWLDRRKTELVAPGQCKMNMKIQIIPE